MGYVRNRVLKVASQVKSELAFAVASRDEHAMDIQQFGLSEGIATAIHGANGQKYKMAGEWSVDALKAFVEDFEAGKLEAYMKSEPIPEDDDSGVTTVVGKNFDDVVMQSGKDVLVEFYAPWCGHCKTLAPKWEELGNKVKGDDSIVIAKVDATANDFPPEFAVTGYPP